MSTLQCGLKCYFLGVYLESEPTATQLIKDTFNEVKKSFQFTEPKDLVSFLLATGQTCIAQFSPFYGSRFIQSQFVPYIFGTFLVMLVGKKNCTYAVCAALICELLALFIKCSFISFIYAIVPLINYHVTILLIRLFSTTAIIKGCGTCYFGFICRAILFVPKMLYNTLIKLINYEGPLAAEQPRETNGKFSKKH